GTPEAIHRRPRSRRGNALSTSATRRMLTLTHPYHGHFARRCPLRSLPFPTSPDPRTGGTRACGRPDGRILVIKEWLVTDGTEHTRSSGELSDQRSAQYVVGVDYGTLSGRAVVVRVSDGSELGSA